MSRWRPRSRLRSALSRVRSRPRPRLGSRIAMGIARGRGDPGGEIELLIPRARQGSYFPSFVEPRRRSEQAIVAVVLEAYVDGVSTRKVDRLVSSWGSILPGLRRTVVDETRRQEETHREPGDNYEHRRQTIDFGKCEKGHASEQDEAQQAVGGEEHHVLAHAVSRLSPSSRCASQHPQ